MLLVPFVCFILASAVLRHGWWQGQVDTRSPSAVGTRDCVSC